MPVWEHFTAEFAEGGLIDGTSADEKEAAFMPTTNDANEGGLAGMRLDKRSTPNATTQDYNGRAMFSRNNTQAYMDANFEPVDHLFVMHENWKFDSSGATKKKAKSLREYNAKVVETRRAKQCVLDQKKSYAAAHVASITIETDKSKLAGYSKPKLEDQLAAHRQFDTSYPKLIPVKSKLKTNSMRLEHLLVAVDRYVQASVHATGSNSGAAPVEETPIDGTNEDDEMDSDEDK